MQTQWLLLRNEIQWLIDIYQNTSLWNKYLRKRLKTDHQTLFNRKAKQSRINVNVLFGSLLYNVLDLSFCKGYEGWFEFLDVFVNPEVFSFTIQRMLDWTFSSTVPNLLCWHFFFKLLSESWCWLSLLNLRLRVLSFSTLPHFLYKFVCTKDQLLLSFSL